MEKIILKSSSGSYTGRCIDNINTFYGIPYAQSCANKNRWQEPKELPAKYSHYESVRGPCAYQTVVNKSFMFDPSLPNSSEAVSYTHLTLPTKRIV